MRIKLTESDINKMVCEATRRIVGGQSKDDYYNIHSSFTFMPAAELNLTPEEAEEIKQYGVDPEHEYTIKIMGRVYGPSGDGYHEPYVGREVIDTTEDVDSPDDFSLDMLYDKVPEGSTLKSKNADAYERLIEKYNDWDYSEYEAEQYDDYEARRLRKYGYYE